MEPQVAPSASKRPFLSLSDSCTHPDIPISMFDSNMPMTKKLLESEEMCSVYFESGIA